MEIAWTDYMKYRANLRGFDLGELEAIVRYSTERYWDEVTHRRVAIGRHAKDLVMLPYEVIEGVLTPVTVHTVTRKQVNFRLKTGRFRNE